MMIVYANSLRFSDVEKDPFSFLKDQPIPHLNLAWFLIVVKENGTESDRFRNKQYQVAFFSPDCREEDLKPPKRAMKVGGCSQS